MTSPLAASSRREFMSSTPTWLLVAALAAAVAVVHLITGWHAEGPVVFDDEGGYLRIARHLAGEGPVAAVRYFPGYSLLIVPIHWALGSTWSIFLGVKVLNAVLGGVTVVLAYLTTGYLMPRDERWKRLGATAIVAMYPSYLLFSNQAFSENALVPLSLLLAYLVARWLPARPRWIAAVGLGVLGAFAMVIHPRSVGVAAALTLVVAVWWWPWRLNVRRIVAFVAALAVVGVLGLLLVQWERTGASAGSGTYGLDATLSERLSLGGLFDLLAGAAGQILYLLLATGGLVVLVGIEVATVARRAFRERDRSARTALLMYVGVAFVLVFATSVFFISPKHGGGRGDTVIYGRYNEGLMAPILLVGATSLVSHRFLVWDRRRIWVSALPWLVGLAVLSAVGVQFMQADRLLRTHFVNPFNVLTVYPIAATAGGVYPFLFAALAIGAGAAFMVLARWNRLAAVTLALAVFVAITARMAFFYLPRDHYEVREQERRVAETANLIDDRFGIECLGVDRVDQPIYHVQLYRWYVDELPLVEFSSDWSQPETPCGALVVTARADLDDAYPNARLVTREGRGIESYLWVLPGELQEQLEAEGMLS